MIIGFLLFLVFIFLKTIKKQNTPNRKQNKSEICLYLVLYITHDGYHIMW
ncbi:hypothetical protein HMPREF9420_2389 [Segatella salivae DSM 15606]|uniref:Uncharacterized protein n=1 Tax=Segatella salivae DSM 15606 TaxID=888832 RepID=E6MSC1_9BACT|nr:hypothetical protein HMPREF9420_2389 [Segatella salivae DSM 15606]